MTAADSSTTSRGAVGKSWAIVLAAGEGTRLRELTTTGGVATPKQYCSLRGGRSLLGDALARAARIVPRKRVVVVVAEEHRSFWGRELRVLAAEDVAAENTAAECLAENIIVQPRNKGTAAGILLPLLAVLERDPEAKIAVLPSDHFVEREYVIESSLRLALESLEEGGAGGDGATLLGITPDAAETGYGWIVPARSDRLLRPVERFVEKPEASVATELFARGALWNSFLFAVRGGALLRTYQQRLPGLLESFRMAFAGERSTRPARLAALYEELEPADFSRDILQGYEHNMRLETVPPCGWTDLGTPARVEACLLMLREERDTGGGSLLPEPRAAFDLAHAVRRMRAALQGEPAVLTALAR